MSLFVIFRISGPFTCHRKRLNMYVINKKNKPGVFFVGFFFHFKGKFINIVRCIYVCNYISHTGRLIIPIIMIIPEADCPTNSALALQLSS